MRSTFRGGIRDGKCNGAIPRWQAMPCIPVQRQGWSDNLVGIWPCFVNPDDASMTRNREGCWAVHYR